jgi:hypothetical protein
MKLGLLLMVAILAACTEQPSDPNMIGVQCRLTKKEDTGRHQYCGKACTKHIYRYYFACPPSGFIEE